MSTDGTHQTLKHRAIRGGAFTFASQWIRFALRILAVVLLSRLLLRDDFGLVAMVTAFTGFASLFADAGLTQAALRAKELKHEQATTLFWINLAVAVAVAAILSACSPLVAWFYGGRQELVPITIVASIGLVVGALGAQHLASLQREFKFGPVAAVEIASQVAGTVVAIVIALVWRSYWALVAQVLASNLASTVGAWIASGWVPGRPRLAAGTRSLLTQGGHLSGSEVLNYIRMNADGVILGRFSGAGELGEYNRALNLLMMPLTQVLTPFTRVAVPLLAKLQDEPVRFARAYYRMCMLVALVTTPIVAVLMIGARDIIAIALGPNFAEAGAIFQVLALASWGMPIAATVTWVAIATGQTKELMGRNLLRAVVFVAACLIGVSWGAIGVAWGYVIAAHLLRIPLTIATLRGTPASFSGLAKATMPGTVIGVVGALAMALPTYVLPRYVAVPQPWGTLGATLLVGAVVMGATTWLWPRARRETKEAIELLRGFKRRPTPTSPEQEASGSQATSAPGK